MTLRALSERFPFSSGPSTLTRGSVPRMKRPTVVTSLSSVLISLSHPMETTALTVVIRVPPWRSC